MTAKEIIEKVKILFTELTTPPAAPVAAPLAAPVVTEYDLKDGGKVSIDKLEVGGIVMIDGNPSLPGDLELADGTKLTVADNGVISAVTPGAAAPPAAHEMDMATKFASFETSATEKFTSYEAKFTAYEQRFAANELQFEAYKTELAKYKTMIEQLLQFGKLMVEKPAALPDPAVRGQFKEEMKETDFTPGLF